MDNYFYIDGKKFNNVINASGCRSRYNEQLDELVNNGMGTIITKTCTLVANNGNLEPNFKEINDSITINCLGMPNCGYVYYRDLLPNYYKRGITYIISMDASNWDDLSEMLIDYDKFIGNMKNGFGIDDKIREFVEINVSCPNKLDIITGNTTRIIAYEPCELSRLLENIKQLDLININIGVKLSPYIDKILLEQIAEVLINYCSIVKYIVCSNSIPNCMIMDLHNGKPLLSVKTGGVSGTVNKLISISNIYQFNNIFNALSNITNMKTPIIIIGCGGIENINDVKEYLIVGCKGVQIGRLLYINGVEHDNIKDIIQKYCYLQSKL